MRILWLCSTPTPEIAKTTGIKSAINVSWIVNTLNKIKETNDVEMCITFPVDSDRMVEGSVDSVQYFGFPRRTKNLLSCGNKMEDDFVKVLTTFAPDVVHIWGTEYYHTLAMVKACEKMNVMNKVVISIQGLCSVIEKHYYANLPYKIVNRYTLRDLLKRENIKKQKEIFKKRGIFETEALTKVMHVIGRTDWDKACVLQINPNINYHFCNETLRESFYNNKWEYDKCEKHSIFVSQGHYPLKGLHFALEALAILKKEYPDVKLYVGGVNMVNRGWKISSYGKYIKELIDKYALNNNVQFTGMLDEEKMCNQYLKANVFVSSSSIENSCNSLCEAMMLGVPSVSSDVGGVKSLYRHEEDGYIYPHDEPYMLAYYIKEIFNDEGNVVNMCQKARQRALETHNKAQNTQQLIKIYEKIQGLTDE